MAVRNPKSKIRIGVSSCLLGEPVRWNGEHKLDSYLKNVLGMFKKQLTERERGELIEAIENYRNGSASLIKPVTRIKRHTRKYKVVTLAHQVYLYPHPPA